MAAVWRKMRTRPWLTAVLVVVLIGAGGGAWWYFQKGNTATAATATSVTRSVPASISTITSSVSASGTVTPAVQDSVSFGASGTVTSVRVTEGQTVRKGQVLGTVGTVNLKAALASAEATLASAQAKVAAAQAAVVTAQALVTTDQTAVTTAQTAVTAAAATSDATDDTTAATQLSDATANLTTAKAQVTADQAQVTADQAQVATAKVGVVTAQTGLADAVLKSPITGLVATVGVAVGDSVSGSSAAGSSSAASSAGGSGGSNASGSGGTGATGGSAAGGSGSSSGSGSTASGSSSTAPFLIVSTTSWEANVTVDDSSINLIKPGLQAQLIVGSSQTPIFGTVASVGLISTSSGSTASYPVVVAVTGSPTGLHDGTAAAVTLIYRAADQCAHGADSRHPHHDVGQGGLPDGRRQAGVDRDHHGCGGQRRHAGPHRPRRG